MDLKALIAKMDSIESGLSEDRAEYDRYKADDAKAAAVEKVKQYASIPLDQIPRLANAIDPKTGVIYYGDAGGEAGNVTPKKMPLQFMSQPDQKPMLDAIKAAGLAVVPHDEKTLFGSAQYAKVDPAKLADIMSGIVPNDDAATLEKLKKLMALVDQYLALKAKKKAGGATAPAQGARPTLTPKESVELKGSIARSLTESFGYEVSEEQTDEGLGAAASKLLGRAAPGVGAVLGAQGAYDSFKKGDYLGAALNGLSGAFSLVPGLGWIPALGFGAWQAGRELSGATDKYDNPQAAGATPAQQGGANPTQGGFDPKLQALQKKLIAAGADLGPSGADGIMGKFTQAAMQKFPNIKEGTEMKSVAESIRELQQRLSLIENPEEMPVDAPVVEADPAPEPATGEEEALAKKLEQAGGKLMEKDDRTFMVLPEKGLCVEIPSMEVVDASTPALTPTGKKFNPAEFGLSESQDLEEGFWDSLVKGAVNFGKGAAAGVKNPNLLKNVKAVKPGAMPGYAGAKIGSTIAKNPGKTALATGLAGLGGGYAAGKLGQGATAPTPPRSQQGANPTAPTAPTAPAEVEDDEEMKALRAQIDALIKDLSTSKNAEVQKGLADIQAKLK